MAQVRRLTEENALVKAMQEVEEVLNKHGVTISMGYGGNGFVFSKDNNNSVYKSEGEISDNLPHFLDGNYYMSDEHGNILQFDNEE